MSGLLNLGFLPFEELNLSDLAQLPGYFFLLECDIEGIGCGQVCQVLVLVLSQLFFYLFCFLKVAYLETLGPFRE
jgi:hypothetical protein